MEPESHAADHNEESAEDSAPAPRISEWIWRPWYAKLWWGLIPVYWIGAVIARKFTPLEVFYSSALAGFVNVFMFPTTVLFVLCAGFVCERIGKMEWVAEQKLGHGSSHFGRKIGRPPPTFDPLDPRSGVNWIGSPENPMNKHRS